jgi:hypothetical protein
MDHGVHTQHPPLMQSTDHLKSLKETVQKWTKPSIPGKLERTYPLRNKHTELQMTWISHTKSAHLYPRNF